MHSTLLLSHGNLFFEILNLFIRFLFQVFELVAKLLFLVLHLIFEFFHGLVQSCLSFSP